jgi:hypothetical protein
MIKTRTVHGNSDVIEQEFETEEEAASAILSQERSRHGDSFELSDLGFSYDGGSFAQFGSDYHYIELQRNVS